jgi:hypothetical protein
VGDRHRRRSRRNPAGRDSSQDTRAAMNGEAKRLTRRVLALVVRRAPVAATAVAILLTGSATAATGHRRPNGTHGRPPPANLLQLGTTGTARRARATHRPRRGQGDTPLEPSRC